MAVQPAKVQIHVSKPSSNADNRQTVLEYTLLTGPAVPDVVGGQISFTPYPDGSIRVDLWCHDPSVSFVVSEAVGRSRELYVSVKPFGHALLVSAQPHKVDGKDAINMLAEEPAAPPPLPALEPAAPPAPVLTVETPGFARVVRESSERIARADLATAEAMAAAKATRVVVMTPPSVSAQDSERYLSDLTTSSLSAEEVLGDEAKKKPRKLSKKAQAEANAAADAILVAHGRKPRTVTTMSAKGSKSA